MRRRKYPREWLERVPAQVFACLIPGELRIILHPGVGLADGGIPWNVSMSKIPFELRMPNTPLWLELDDDLNILRVWRREIAPTVGDHEVVRPDRHWRLGGYDIRQSIWGVLRGLWGKMS
jgi:hypothetical protein